MKIYLMLIAFIVSFTTAAQAADVRIDPALKDFAQGKGPKIASVLVLMNMSKTAPAPLRYDTRSVKYYLHGQTNLAAKDLNGFLHSSGLSKSEIQVQNVFWINNSFSAKLTANALKVLANSPQVKKIYLNRAITRDLPSPRGRADEVGSGGQGTYAFHAMQLDTLIEKFPAITGKGVLVGHIDTGVDGEHPALKDKIALFYDVFQKKPVPARDSDRHGTHTAGTILGGNRTDNRIGVAPEAKLISIGPSLSYEQMLAGMQFLMDPDGDPNTSDNPKLVSNSWNTGGAPDQELFYTAIGAWEAAGILPVFSAGNAGPSAGSITLPHEHPATLAVGATGENGLVTDFSSRGPGNYKGTVTQKPDLTAPGDNIRSSVPGGGYELMSGTSMAAPHVSGVVALMLQVNPKLNPAQIKQILAQTADAVDADGKPTTTRAWNANYGNGKINALAAVTAAQNFVPQTARPRFALKLMDLTSSDSAVSSPSPFYEPSVEEDLTMPSQFEGHTWLTAKDLW